MFCGRQFCSRQKGGDAVGKTKRGKGTKWMVAIDGRGIALGSTLHSASPAEATLVEGTLATISVPRQHGGRPRQKPQRVIAERANDSDSLRRWLQARGIELVCSHRKSRRNPPTQDGRALRRYRKRWKVERTFAWPGELLPSCRALRETLAHVSSLLPHCLHSNHPQALMNPLLARFALAVVCSPPPCQPWRCFAVVLVSRDSAGCGISWPCTSFTTTATLPPSTWLF